MSIRRAYCIFFGSYLSFLSFADGRVSVDILDPTDGGQQPPRGVLVLDVMFEPDPGDSWLASGISVAAVNGSQFIYGWPEQDQPDITNPGSADPFVTCISVPLPRFGNGRFNQCFAAVAGNTCPGSPVAIMAPDLFGVDWFDERLGLCDQRPSNRGAIARVALQIDAKYQCEGDLNCCYGLYSISEIPQDAIHIIEGVCVHGSFPEFGIAWGTCVWPSVFFLNWLLVQNHNATSCRFDVNRDRSIDVSDLSLVLAAFGASSSEPLYDPLLDFDTDEVIALQDLALLLSHWGPI